MSWQKFSDFLYNLKFIDLSPIIVVYGSDRFLRQQLLGEIINKMGAGKKVEQEIFYANETEPEQVLISAQTYSMFAPLKVVLVYQLQLYSPSKRNELLRYLENPDPGTRLIMFADPPSDYSEEKRFRDWFLGVSKKIDVVDVSGLSARELEALAKNLIRASGKRISEEALALLLDATGMEPERIKLELEKIDLYLGEAKLITPELVSELVIGTGFQNIFELAESLARRDLSGTLKRYRRIVQQKQPREMILGIIKRHYRILLELQASLGSEQMEEEVLHRFRVPRNFASQYQAQAKRLRESDLKKVFKEFYLAECELKSSALSDEAIMERLILRLCQI